MLRLRPRNRLLMLAVVATVISALAGCSGNGSGDGRADMVYVCTETGHVISGPVDSTPAINPATGRKTMMPGLYCSKCQKWYPSPPPEISQRNPSSRLCPKHRTAMDLKGPI